MVKITWDGPKFGPVNLWSVHAAWKLSKPFIIGRAMEPRITPNPKAESNASRMIAAISPWR